jgi:hypothetical protein
MIHLDTWVCKGVQIPKGRDGDLWSLYKRRRAHNQGRQIGRQGDQEEIYGFEAGLDEEG